jgi:hypothetical protein
MDMSRSIKVVDLDRAVGNMSILDHEAEIPLRREASVLETGSGYLSQLDLSLGV